MRNEAKEYLSLRRRLRSFVHAFSGWWFVLSTQPNSWVHAIISIGVLALGVWLQVSLLEWAVLLLTTMAVWMAEFFNTALEAVVDIASPEYHPLAKIAKDVAAAAVLVGAFCAVIIGLLIMGPPLWGRLFS